MEGDRLLEMEGKSRGWREGVERREGVRLEEEDGVESFRS